MASVAIASVAAGQSATVENAQGASANGGASAERAGNSFASELAAARDRGGEVPPAADSAKDGNAPTRAADATAKCEPCTVEPRAGHTEKHGDEEDANRGKDESPDDPANTAVPVVATNASPVMPAVAVEASAVPGEISVGAATSPEQEKSANVAEAAAAQTDRLADSFGNFVAALPLSRAEAAVQGGAIITNERKRPADAPESRTPASDANQVTREMEAGHASTFGVAETSEQAVVDGQKVGLRALEPRANGSHKVHDATTSNGPDAASKTELAELAVDTNVAPVTTKVVASTEQQASSTVNHAVWSADAGKKVAQRVAASNGTSFVAGVKVDAARAVSKGSTDQPITAGASSSKDSQGAATRIVDGVNAAVETAPKQGQAHAADSDAVQPRPTAPPINTLITPDVHANGNLAARASRPSGTNLSSAETRSAPALPANLGPVTASAIAARAIETLRNAEMHMGWHSEQLGRVDIRAEVRGHEVAAAVRVESDAGRQWMAAELPGLIEALSRQELNVGSLQVADFSSGGSQGQGGNAQQQRAAAGTALRTEHDEMQIDAETLGADLRTGQGLSIHV